METRDAGLAATSQGAQAPSTAWSGLAKLALSQALEEVPESEARSSAQVKILEQAQGSSGTPLSWAERRPAERLTGTNLSDVRVHNDASAHAAAAAVGARAYAVGRDIYMGEGQYQPGSPDGQKLLVHELVHTAQQGSRSGVEHAQLATSQPDEAAELEAVKLSQAMTPGDTLTGLGGSAAAEGSAGIATTDAAPKIYRDPILGVAKVASRLLKWLGKRGFRTFISKHIARHGREIAGRALHTVFKNPRKIRSLVMKAGEEALALAQRTVGKRADEVIEGASIKLYRQAAGPGKFRWVIEKEFRQVIGTKGEKVLKIIVDASGRIVTAYPVEKLSALGLGVVATGLFDARSANAAEQIQGIVEADAKHKEEEENSWGNFVIDLFTPILLMSSPLNDGESLWLARRDILEQTFAAMVAEIEQAEKRTLSEGERRQLYDLLEVSIGSAMISMDEEDQDAADQDE